MVSLYPYNFGILRGLLGSAAGPTLGTITLSPLTATAGVPYSGTLSGNTGGSTVTYSSSDGTVLTVTGTTVTGTFAAAGSPTVTPTETLSGASNTPHVSPGQTMVVSAPPDTFDSTTGWTWDSTAFPTFDRSI